MSMTVQEVCAVLADSQQQLASAEMRAYDLRHGPFAQAAQASAGQARRVHGVVAALCNELLTKFGPANEEGMPNVAA